MQTVSVRMCVNKLATSRDFEYLKLRHLLSDSGVKVNKKNVDILKKNDRVQSINWRKSK